MVDGFTLAYQGVLLCGAFTLLLFALFFKDLVRAVAAFARARQPAPQQRRPPYGDKAWVLRPHP